MTERGDLRPMRSVLPTVSSVAWSSFMTASNPGHHNIYGFVERQPASYDLFFPNARQLRARTLWQHLQDHQKRIVVINVPATYPTRDVHGVMIGGFLCTDIEKVSTDAAVVRWLKQNGYRIDADVSLAHHDKGAFLDDLDQTLDRRIDAIRHFLRDQPWDYFQGHIMETDRLQHFLWEEMEQGTGPYRDRFLDLYRKVDGAIGRFRDELSEEVPLLLLSDHGFCAIRQEVFLNRYLIERGFLRMRDGSSELLSDVDADHTLAYSLIPGRIYVNLEGREPGGIVEPGGHYDEVRRRVATALEELKDPETGQAIIRQVIRREELYAGRAFAESPDLLAVPQDGYDLKGRFRATTILQRTALNGMHTYEDAMLLSDRPLLRDPDSIVDVAPTLLDLMGLPPLENADGSSLLSKS